MSYEKINTTGVTADPIC